MHAEWDLLDPNPSMPFMLGTKLQITYHADLKG